MTDKTSTLDILEKTHEIFINLLRQSSDSDSTSIFGLSLLNRTDFINAARAATQLIEVCYWLGFTDVLRPQLSPLMKVLRKGSFKDQALVQIHPSRMKAILLYGEYDLLQVANTVEHLCDEQESYSGTFLSITHLSYVDLLGTFDKLKPNLQDLGIVERFLRFRSLPSRVALTYSKNIEQICAAVMKEDFFNRYELSAVSFTLRLLIVSRMTDDPAIKLRVKEICLEIEKEVSKRISRLGGSGYGEWSYAHLNYAITLLLWCRRKLGWDVLNSVNVSEWFRSCAETLITQNNPYHQALLLKPVVAELKTEFLILHSRSGVSASIEIQRKSEALELATVSDDIVAALGAASNYRVFDIQRLTAGWSRAAVYGATFEHSPPVTTNGQRLPESIVIKLGTHTDIVAAARIYSALPKSSHSLFVEHQSNPTLGTIGTRDLHFVIMNRLQDYLELNQAIKNCIPHDDTGGHDMKRLGKVLDVSLRLIHNLHSVDVSETSILTKDKKWKAKLALLFDYVDRVSQKSPVLARLVNQGCTLSVAGEIVKISSAHQIINRLLTVPDMLVRPNYLKKNQKKFVLVHGDCHANNIMIKEGHNSAAFIDIADCHIGDYLDDYAQLVAHLCFSACLETCPDHELAITLPASGDISCLVNIEPAFSHRAIGLKYIFETVLKEVVRFADPIADKDAINRFLINLGHRLIFIASRTRSKEGAHYLYINGIHILEQVMKRLKKRSTTEELVTSIYVGEWINV
ncbi:aminoglycoside phosphotransferase family protein [bacterium AH-315-J21]|nr:aminoglycoside phosphotransferase family protein [bacterium AH-315-J21]